MATEVPPADPDGAAEAKQIPPEKPGSDGALPDWIKSHAVAIVSTTIAAAVALVGSGVGVAVWISGQFADIRKDMATGFTDVRKEVSDLRAEVRADSARTNEKLEGLNTRLTRLENRMDAKFGAEDPDAGAPPDGGAFGPWSAGHVERRGKFCAARCKDDAPCLEQCAADYNLCGIRCPATPVSTCFVRCVAALGSIADAGP